MHGGFRFASRNHGFGCVCARGEARVDGHPRLSARRRARPHRALRVRRRHVLAARRVRASIRGRRLLRSGGADRTRRLHLPFVLRDRQAGPRDRTVHARRRVARGVRRPGACIVSARHHASRRGVRPSSAVPARIAIRRARVPAVRLRIGTRPPPHRRGSVPGSRGRDRRRLRRAGALRPAGRATRGATAATATRRGPRAALPGGIEAARRNHGARGDHRSRSGSHTALRRRERDGGARGRGDGGDGIRRDRRDRNDPSGPRSPRERHRRCSQNPCGTASRRRRRGERRGSIDQRHLQRRRQADEARKRGRKLGRDPSLEVHRAQAFRP